MNERAGRGWRRRYSTPVAAASFIVTGATVRAPGRAVRIAAAAMVGPLLGFVCFAAGLRQPQLSYIGVLAVAEATLLFLTATLVPRVLWGEGPKGKTTVRVDEQGLWFDRRRVLSRESVANVSLSLAPRRNVIVAAGPAPLSTFEIVLEDEGAARGLTAALDRSGALPSYSVDAAPLLASRRWLVMALRAAAALPVLALLLTLMTLKLRAVLPVGYVPLVALAALFVFRREAPMRVVLGADGLALWGGGRAGLWRFVPFRLVENAVPCERGVELRLASGDALTLRVAGVDPNVDAQGDALATAVLAGFSHARLSTRDMSLEATLERGTRDRETWMRELRALRERGGYRALSLSEERLVAAVEDPHAEPTVREAAAVLLASAGATELGDRIREAAARAAAPGLAAALAASATRR